MENIIKLWKDLDIKEVRFEYDCGGDSMGDTHITIHTNSNETIENDEVEKFFDNEVYKVVDFYVNSDGHYIGESGVVIITFDKDEQDFSFFKDAMSQYSETITEEVGVKLTKVEIDFINKFVESFGGGMDERTTFNYKMDFIITDEFDALMESIKEKVDKVARYHRPEVEQGDDDDVEFGDWYRFTTNEDDISETEVKIENDEVIISVTCQYYMTIPSD